MKKNDFFLQKINNNGKNQNKKKNENSQKSEFMYEEKMAPKVKQCSM